MINRTTKTAFGLVMSISILLWMLTVAENEHDPELESRNLIGPTPIHGREAKSTPEVVEQKEELGTQITRQDGPGAKSRNGHSEETTSLKIHWRYAGENVYRKAIGLHIEFVGRPVESGSILPWREIDSIDVKELLPGIDVVISVPQGAEGVRVTSPDSGLVQDFSFDEVARADGFPVRNLPESFQSGLKITMIEALSLSGRLLSPNGTIESVEELSLYALPNSPPFASELTEAKSGIFRFGSLRPGRYALIPKSKMIDFENDILGIKELWARPEVARLTESVYVDRLPNGFGLMLIVQVAGNRPIVDLVLPVLVHRDIQLKTVNKGGQPVPHQAVVAVPAVAGCESKTVVTGPTGQALLEDITTGTWDFYLRSAGKQSVYSVRTKIGPIAPEQVVLVTPGGFRVNVVAIDSKGQPIEGLSFGILSKDFDQLHRGKNTIFGPTGKDGKAQSLEVYDIMARLDWLADPKNSFLPIDPDSLPVWVKESDPTIRIQFQRAHRLELQISLPRVPKINRRGGKLKGFLARIRSSDLRDDHKTAWLDSTGRGTFTTYSVGPFQVDVVFASYGKLGSKRFRPVQNIDVYCGKNIWPIDLVPLKK